ncbi:Protein OS-9, partial [Characodon lateralis]|nr:Protein OS-9 [Characodon lateralis]
MRRPRHIAAHNSTLWMDGWMLPLQLQRLQRSGEAPHLYTPRAGEFNELHGLQPEINSFLNLEELNEMKYGIQILPDPVMLGQTKTEEVVMVSNKYKQLYECRLPAQAVRFHQDPASEPDSQGYTGPDVPDLLRPMHKAPCLVKTKDWWTYEFCHGQHIRQYHLE